MGAAASHDGGESATITALPATAWSEPLSATVARHSGPANQLGVGTVLAERYEIVEILGEGGMGAVYKARDREVGHLVALKVIRPELANQQEILHRFKQELILARQITHKNVIRIFDLGQAEGIRFITMEFVEGLDLHSLLRAGQKFTLGEKVRIVQQVCRALEAAHGEGVVHRDLKPHNILVEEGGRVVVMDFGIARSLQATGGQTSTGALLGTPAYMSPEQAKGDRVDTRSDLFSLGVIFYELLTGKPPYESETMVGLLLKRIQERPIPPVEHDKDIPAGLSDVVLKCLAVDLGQRYQTARELLMDLEAWQTSPGTFRTVAGTVAAPPVHAPQIPPPSKGASGRRFWKWSAVAAPIVLLALALVLFRERFFSSPPGQHAPVTVMIADFNNHTGDPIFDGTLESTMKLALEGANFISAYDRGRLRDLGIAPADQPKGKLDETAATKIAVGQGLGVVISGALQQQGAGYDISVKAVQAVTGATLGAAEETAANRDQVLFAVTKLATALRKDLGDSTSDSAQRFAMETLSAASIEAVHNYALAMEAISNSRNEDALKNFASAANADPNFGLAYAGMAISSNNLDIKPDAERYIKQALQHIDRMTERERYRTRGMYYYINGDQQRCADEYGQLLARYPSDVAGHNNLGICYVYLRNIPRALDEMQKAVQLMPKRSAYQFNHALYQAYAGDFPAAEREIQAALQLNPTFPRGDITLAYVALGKGELDKADAAYRELEKTSAIGASLAASGFADLAIYEGRFSDAGRMLEQGAAQDAEAGRSDAAADKLNALAYVQMLRGQNRAAADAADRALKRSQSVKARFFAARAFVAAGETAKARALAEGLAKELPNEPQSYAKLIEGEMALKDGDTHAAAQAFTQAVNLLDTWIGRFDLGRAYLNAEAFTDADSQFDACIKRRGEAMELFMDDVPTYGYFPSVYYYLGLVREGLKSPGYADSYRKYLDIRGKSSDDPLVSEVRRRAGK
ncbi:MAG TPA: protein kinase [Bryobacteraceae bacterium]|jgi:tetratricopeptide (TPR) repeat protein/predicted Ser/Thr protein kinase